MKRFAIAATAALMAASSFATPAAAQNYRGNDRGQDARDHRNDNGRNDRRDNNRRQQWTRSQHNGYFVGNRWYFGPPPASMYNRSDYRPGYHQWRRGERLPSYYRSNYREVDWRRDHLRAPPRGYHYVRDDRGETLLVAVATGVILGVILANN